MNKKIKNVEDLWKKNLITAKERDRLAYEQSKQKNSKKSMKLKK